MGLRETLVTKPCDKGEGGDHGGQAAAVCFSLTGACKHHGIDLFSYLRDILTRLPSTSTGWPDELLPDVWFVRHAPARRKTVA